MSGKVYSLSSFTQMYVTILTMVMSDWWVDKTFMKDEWRCVLTVFGEQFVMISGAVMMPVWFADNWDSHQ